MTKSEILVVLKQMQNAWEFSVDNHKVWVVLSSCQEGFCFWLYFKNAKSTQFVMNELEKDLNKKVLNMEYWYNTYNNVGCEALIPRLEHINRTIARLENELKN